MTDDRGHRIQEIGKRKEERGERTGIRGRRSEIRGQKGLGPFLPKVGHFGRENCLRLCLYAAFETARFFPPNKIKPKCNSSDTPCQIKKREIGSVITSYGPRPGLFTGSYRAGFEPWSPTSPPKAGKPMNGYK
ncbi:MAG: hypothetical protein L6406_23130 [Desulfobacterales bacterium]|nr:hypothetical protein [Desulfobacterales bacterium]